MAFRARKVFGSFEKRTPVLSETFDKREMIRNCNDFKEKITKYQLKKQIGLILNKRRQYNILGFDFNMPSDPKSFRDSEPGFCKRYGFFFTISILVKVKK